MPNVEIKRLQKVFGNVKEAGIYGGKWNRQWPTFVECFPNLRRLDVMKIEVNTRLVGNSLRHLEDLDICSLKCSGLKTCRAVADIMNGAHRLKYLTILNADDFEPINVLLEMLKDCPTITRLRTVCKDRVSSE